jgi:RimJ/RimL family protein N-acetyltransferase
MPDWSPQLPVALRPVRDEDFWIFERQAVDPAAVGSFNWSGFRAVARLKRQHGENNLIDTDGGRLIVLADEAAVGDVVWRKVSYGDPSWWCWNIGISLLPEARGRGTGTAAQRLLVTYLFETTTANRVEAYTDVANVAEQRALAKAGFTRDGLLRAVQFRGGQWRDLYLYGLLRREFDGLTGAGSSEGHDRRPAG